MQNKAMGTVVVALAIGCLLGFGGGYYYMQPNVQSAFAEGMAYQASVEPQTYYTTAADVEFAWTGDDNDFDHDSTVDASGNVASDTTDTQIITITNDDDAIDIGALYITLVDPSTGEEGIDEDLEDAIEDINVYFEYGGISKLTLMKEGEYVSGGRNLGELPAGSEMELTITVELLEHDDEDFPDGKELDCELYIWQPDANHVDEVDFTIST
jgi:hypothetical protein